MKTSISQRQAISKYDKNNCIQMSLKFNKKTDADILQHLEPIKNKQGFIKMLIRKDITKLKKRLHL